MGHSGAQGGAPGAADGVPGGTTPPGWPDRRPGARGV